MYDVIIVGAGPSGSTLAYLLARDNYKVLLIEKELSPGKKPCGGGFQFKIQSVFDFSLEPVIARRLKGLVLKDRRLETRFEFVGEENSLCITRREEFDNYIFKRAIEKGATAITGERVIGVSNGLVFTKGKSFRGKIVVLADGFPSLLRKISHYVKRMWIKTISGRIEGDFPPYGILDFTFVKNGMMGYFWLFPGDGWASIGFGCNGKSYCNILKIFSHYLKLYSLPVPDMLEPYAYPVFNGELPNLPGGFLALGDALSLASPSTGGGIYQAIRSAEIAFKAIKITRGIKDVSKVYLHLLKRELLPPLYIDLLLSRIFYNLPYPYKIPSLRMGVPIFRVAGRI